MSAVDYELALNPIRYRHNIITSIVKQYIRDNFIFGELEIELSSPIKNKSKNFNTLSSDHSPDKSVSGFSGVQSMGNFSNFIQALQDTMGKATKRKSAHVPNYIKIFKGHPPINDFQEVKEVMNPNSRRFSKDAVVLKLFKVMRYKAFEYVKGKRSAQE